MQRSDHPPPSVPTDFLEVRWGQVSIRAGGAGIYAAIVVAASILAFATLALLRFWI